jgi:hypothetical protein
MKTGYSCHTKKDQSHPHSMTTGFSGRDRDENYWENGWRWPRSDHKTKGECYGWTPTHSQRTFGSTRSRRRIESDRCDLCRVLWITEDRFRTEKANCLQVTIKTHLFIIMNQENER